MFVLLQPLSNSLSLSYYNCVEVANHKICSPLEAKGIKQTVTNGEYKEMFTRKKVAKEGSILEETLRVPVARPHKQWLSCLFCCYFPYPLSHPPLEDSPFSVTSALTQARNPLSNNPKKRKEWPNIHSHTTQENPKTQEEKDTSFHNMLH